METVELCTCSPAPVRATVKAYPNAVVRDIVNDDGRWHGLYDEASGKVFCFALVAPSAAKLAREPAYDAEAAARADAAEARIVTLNTLRAKRRGGGRLSEAEKDNLLDALLGI